MSKEEKRLVRAAAKALNKLARYREKHGHADALHHVYVSARLAGWPDAHAHEAARLMTSAGVTPLEALRMFGDSDRRVQ